MIKDKKIEYNILRTNRKTIGIKISAEGVVTVSAPIKCGRETIEGIVTSKAPWILEKLQMVLERNKQLKIREFKSGERILLLGKEYSLEIIEKDEGKCSAIYDHIRFKVFINRAVERGQRERLIEEALQSLLRRLAREILTERTRLYAEHMLVNFSKITHLEAGAAI